MLFSKVASTYVEVGLQFVSKSEILRSHVIPLPPRILFGPKTRPTLCFEDILVLAKLDGVGPVDNRPSTD